MEEGRREEAQEAQFLFYLICRSSMANAVNEVSAEEKRWMVVGICLTKILAPTLRKAVRIEMEDWYTLLRKPPTEIHKQVYEKHMKTLPPSTFRLQYRNINNNNQHKLFNAYDYGVKDSLSLARLFVQQFMANFTDFDDTMDLSVILTIMCEAQPFTLSTAAACARYLKTEIRNAWAHSCFAQWTERKFSDAINKMQALVEITNLSATVKKEACDELQNTGIC